MKQIKLVLLSFTFLWAFSFVACQSVDKNDVKETTDQPYEDEDSGISPYENNSD